MKRFFFTTIALAAVAVSCTKSGLLESPKTYEAPISFEPYTGKSLATKASVVETANIEEDGFKVVGFIEAASSTTITPSVADFTFEKVYKSGDAWKYDGEAAYWPEGQDLTFVAYGLNANVTNPVEGNYAQIGYAVPSKVAEQKDLVLSPVMQNLNGVSQDGPVSVYLYHALSRIGFTLKTQGTKDATSEAAVTIKDVSIYGNFATSATFDLSRIAAPTTGVKTLTYIPYADNTATTYNFKPGTPTATRYSLFDLHLLQSGAATPYFVSDQVPEADDDTEGYTTTSDNNFTYKTYPVYHTTNKSSDNVTTPLTNPDIAARYMMIMPGAVGNFTESNTFDFDGDDNKEETFSPCIKVVYQLEDAQEQTAIINLVKDGANWTFEPGKAYEFVFTVSTIAVGFNVDVKIWDPTSTSNNTTVTVPIVQNLPL